MTTTTTPTSSSSPSSGSNKRLRTSTSAADASTEDSTSATLAAASELAALFDDFMQFGSVGLHIVDNNGMIVWANQAELDLLGYSPAEYFGKPISDFHVDQDKLSDILTTLLDGRKVQNFIAPLRCKDGHTEYVEINSSMRQVNGKCVTTRCFSARVTDRILREKAELQAIETQKEAARQEEETVRKTEFLRKLCHELRNPLAGVSGNLELLLAELQQAVQDINNNNAAESPETKLAACQERLTAALDYTKSAQLAAEHQMLVINDTLSLSRLESQGGFDFKPQPVHVPTVLDSVQAIMGVKADEKGIHVQYDITDEAARNVRTDPVWLKQILINLVSNAVKFTDSAGHVSVQVGCLHDKNDENNNDKKKKKQKNNDVTLQVVVQDTGIGMTEAEQARLFGVFCQANERISAQFGGSGLGLHIIQQMLHHVQGTISVTSKKGVGSTFTFTLPCGPPLSPAERATLLLESSSSSSSNSNKSNKNKSTTMMTTTTMNAATETTTTTVSSLPSSSLPSFSSLPLPVASQLRILVVDDSQINRRILTSFLKKRGYGYQQAENGKIALELHQEQPFDLILSDVDMPIMDGMHMTRTLRRQESETSAAQQQQDEEPSNKKDEDEDEDMDTSTSSSRRSITTKTTTLLPGLGKNNDDNDGVGACGVPIIGISGNVLPEDVDAAKLAGMNEYIGKPYKFSQLEALMLKYLSSSSPAPASGEKKRN